MMITIKILISCIVLIGCIWMMMNQDHYIEQTHALEDDVLSYEDWKSQLDKCETQTQAVNWYRERPFDSHKMKYAFYDKMQAIENNEKLKREVLNLN